MLATLVYRVKVTERKQKLNQYGKDLAWMYEVKTVIPGPTQKSGDDHRDTGLEVFLLEEEGGVGDHEEAGGRDEGGEEVVAVDPLEADGSSHCVVVDLLHPEGCHSVLLQLQATRV